MTPYQRHRKRWVNCQRCKLCETRKHVVFLRGKLPADVLFVGEAPGKGEDTLGKPFIGPAGHLLDNILESCFTPRTTIDENGDAIEVQPTYAITNLVGCIPIDEEGNKAVEPDQWTIDSCQQKLVEAYTLCRPLLCVYLGKLAEKHCPKILGIDVRKKNQPKQLSLIHPAAITRMDISQKGLAIQRTKVALSSALDNLFIG